MPAGDGTGPAGLGPMTGRAAGYCAGYSAPGFAGGGWGRGGWGRGGWDRGGEWGRGRRGGGRGRGGGWRHRHWYHAPGLPGWQRAAMWGPPPQGVPPSFYDPPMTAEHELEALKRQAEHLERTLAALRERIQEITSQPEEARGK